MEVACISAQKVTPVSISRTGSNVQEIHLLDLPTELLEHILRFLPFGTIGKYRRVSRWFNSICSTILNTEFHRLRVLMQQRFQSIKAQMPRRESARRKHPLARESDIIETLHMRLTLLQMSFGKHIERKHCCFFAGEIIDEVYKILRYVKTTPSLSRAYKVTDELFDLSTMAMEYFKEHIEPTLPEISYFGSDFLDYTPSFSSSPKTQLSLMEGASSAACNSAKTLGNHLQSHGPEDQPSVKRRIKRLRDNIKRNNNHILVLRRELKLTRQRATAQQKQIIELKARCGDYDKKFQSTSRKLSAILQELSRCTTELQYWRSKSPAIQCSCGKVTPVTELKEPDANILTDREDVLSAARRDSFRDNQGSKDEFKPINADLGSCSTSPEVLVVPSCHCTPISNVGTLNLDSSLKSPVMGDDKTLQSENISISESKPRACKRKLSMDESVKDVQITKHTLGPSL